MKALFLAASLAANAIQYFMLTSATPILPATRPSGDAPVRATIGLSAPGDTRGLRARLERAGLEDKLIKALVYTHVMHSTENAIEIDAGSYWQLDPMWSFDHALALLRAHERARTRLIDIYGDEARTEPAFSELFRPLETRFPFLSGDQQIAVQRIRLEFQRDRADRLRRAARSDTGAGPLSASSGRDTAFDHAALRAALGEVLDDGALFEYELRESPLASQLRASGVGLTEAEYRQAYRILASLDRADAGHERYLAARRDLRTLLGRQRFVTLWASRDPRFAALERAGRKRGLREATIASAYEIVGDTQDEMLRAMSRAGADSERRTSVLRGLREEQERRLAGLVGQEAARELLGEIDRMSRAAITAGTP